MEEFKRVQEAAQLQRRFPVKLSMARFRRSSTGTKIVQLIFLTSAARSLYNKKFAVTESTRIRQLFVLIRASTHSNPEQQLSCHPISSQLPQQQNNNFRTTNLSFIHLGRTH